MRKHLLTAAATASILFTAFGGQASAQENSYTVKLGDSLWKISQATQVSVANLRNWNQLTNDIIYVNQKLSLLAPSSDLTTAAGTVAASESTVTYTVKSGDTLWLIAKANNTTVADLKSLNSLTSDSLYVGQTLQIKGAKADSIAVLSKAQMVVNESQKYIGTPYLWGGTTPSGFDCSGYTKYVFAQIGITLPRTTTLQWTGFSAVSSPNPGDLVFFDISATSPSHVGIYLGNNKFIHAGVSTGVTISDMTTSYWKSTYAGARTVF